MLLAAVLTGDGGTDEAAAAPRALDLQFSARLTGRDGEPAGDIKVEGGAVQLGIDLEGRHHEGDEAKARVELALSTRVAALSVRF